MLPKRSKSTTKQGVRSPINGFESNLTRALPGTNGNTTPLNSRGVAPMQSPTWPKNPVKTYGTRKPMPKTMSM